MKIILAKSVSNQGDQTGRTLVQHIEDLLAVYQVIIEPLNLSEKRKQAIYLACVTHDLGKVNSKFQTRLAANIENPGSAKFNKQTEISHNLLSPAFLMGILERYSLDDVTKEVVIKAVMYHHGNFLKYQDVIFSKVEEAIYFDILQDIISSKEYDLSDINELISNHLEIDYFLSEKEVSYDFFDKFSESFSQSNYDVYQDYIEVKGFLNLIDHLASSLEGEVPNYFLDQGIQRELDETLLSYLKVHTGNLSASFNELQETVISHQSDQLLVTEAFTSAGKTIADDRLVADKKFYLTPNRISAMSFYQEASQKYGAENVGVLHGAIHLYKNEHQGDTSLVISQDDIDLARNYAKPYILATVDQIALAVFKFPNYEKTLVALKKARVCVDEIHLLSPRMFTAFLLLMEYSMLHLGTRYHLMTATLPLSYQEKLAELAERQPQLLVGQNRSAVIETSKGINLIHSVPFSKVENLCRQAIEKQQQVLIVLNSVKDVISTYEKLKAVLATEEVVIKCLHSRFKEETLTHRYQEMAEQEGNIWITTQVVEIALDIDFPIVISDLSPMDSLVQRMGRNNRRGRLSEGGQFYLLEERDVSVYQKTLLDATTEVIKKTFKARKTKKQLSLSITDRQLLLETYYSMPKVKKYYEEEFKESERGLRGVFGLSSHVEMTGESIMFDHEPYKNIADSKKEASKYFRDSGMRVKVYLESDVLSKKALAGKGITISANRMYLLKKSGLVYEKSSGYGSHLLVLKDEQDSVSYHNSYGLVF